MRTDHREPCGPGWWSQKFSERFQQDGSKNCYVIFFNVLCQNIHNLKHAFLTIFKGRVEGH